MDRLPASDYIEKLISLEKAAGRGTGYTMLEPLDVNAGDWISIQNAAPTIATFIGLSDLTFVVSRTKQPTGVGGHVDLVDSEKDVFIDIAPDVAESDSAVLATLSHKIVISTFTSTASHGARASLMPTTTKFSPM